MLRRAMWVSESSGHLISPNTITSYHPRGTRGVACHEVGGGSGRTAERSAWVGWPVRPLPRVREAFDCDLHRLVLLRNETARIQPRNRADIGTSSREASSSIAARCSGETRVANRLAGLVPHRARWHRLPSSRVGLGRDLLHELLRITHHRGPSDRSSRNTFVVRYRSLATPSHPTTRRGAR